MSEMKFVMALMHDASGAAIMVRNDRIESIEQWAPAESLDYWHRQGKKAEFEHIRVVMISGETHIINETMADFVEALYK